jgi:hypothetical protein
VLDELVKCWKVACDVLIKIFTQPIYINLSVCDGRLTRLSLLQLSMPVICGTNDDIDTDTAGQCVRNSQGVSKIIQDSCKIRSNVVLNGHELHGIYGERHRMRNMCMNA